MSVPSIWWFGNEVLILNAIQSECVILTFYAFLAKYVRAGNARNILKCDTT